jgi:hypothetical protein
MRPDRGRAAALAVILVAAVLAGGAYYFLGKQYVYRFTASQLQQSLSARLPYSKTYLLIFDVTLEHPRITLVRGSDRIELGLDVSLVVRLGQQPIQFAGLIDVSGGIRYDPNVGQLFLTHPKVERLDLQGMPAQYASRVALVVSKVVTDYYQDHAIYTLDGYGVREVTARLVLKSVVVDHQQLVVTLGIGL